MYRLTVCTLHMKMASNRGGISINLFLFNYMYDIVVEIPTNSKSMFSGIEFCPTCKRPVIMPSCVHLVHLNDASELPFGENFYCSKRRYVSNTILDIQIENTLLKITKFHVFFLLL